MKAPPLENFRTWDWPCACRSGTEVSPVDATMTSRGWTKYFGATPPPASRSATGGPAPRRFSSGDDGSASRIGSGAGEWRHAVLPPHRSAGQTLFPSLSISTGRGGPHIRPAGGFAQFRTVRGGFGAALGGDG